MTAPVRQMLTVLAVLWVSVAAVWIASFWRIDDAPCNGARRLSYSWHPDHRTNVESCRGAK